MHSKDILKSILTPEFDYNLILNSAKGLRFPRNKIGALLEAKQITRVKKGFYVKTDETYHKFIVANMIYGPSYISHDSALFHYGLIPEKVETVTSTAFLRKRFYSTPIGEFEYCPTQKNCFSFGIDRVLVDENRAYLIATKEKALFDRLYNVKGLEAPEAMFEYLFENMRLDTVVSFNLRALERLAALSKKKFVRTLLEVLRNEHKKHE